ncbi:chemotaxis-specific protein-glutamate methyltransferase CheB [Azospirillum doebereinerae]|uniref:Protein-glutamate methylesterase/protein-glutamine glutaminase n=1 Tax=Azospirillum doebereinerae TaxID=92933 RepID=A0A433J378_9PROT|nr:chemotaxis-specific protein-glutamate methyltransferase CheB [Azospirillum doebereinerae]MCG5244078.1 chemotaxis-specific protein-glutamate methyltransferase CheB [Azospirillum doebereinerae]RUQ66203.1 chemotaxis-specific protein-glutamate methyltransferase CheB [Azospirillum doebereinerae]
MTAPRRIRVLVVEDSPVIQQLLAHLIGADPRLEVAGVASSGEQALRMIERAAPDVVSLDIRLPGIDGFEVTSRIMRQHPVPIVVVASDVRDLDIPMRALQAGALAVVEKPGSVARADYQTVAHHLCTQLVIMSQVKVIRHRTTARAALRPGRGEGAEAVAAGAPDPALEGRRRRFRALGLVASTGGPAALSKLLKELPTDFPLPVFLVQHMGAPFMAGFASWLGTVSPLPVLLAEHGAIPRPGHVYVAPGNQHLTLVNGVVHLTGDGLVCGQRPSGEELFRSMAVAYGSAAIGVLLTGMGEDGARGLVDMRRAGAYTIAEHASTAVIHSMPGTAVKLGGAVEELPLDQVAPRLLQLTSDDKMMS